MKKLFIAMALFFAFINNSFAQSAELSPKAPNVLTAELKTLDINHNWLENNNGGNISIDLDKKEITMILFQEVDCKPGMVCILGFPTPDVIKLPIVDIVDDQCGAITYIAEQDKTPVDGLQETLTVTDYATLVCRIHVPHMTTIKYKTFNPWGLITEISNFTAGTLDF